MEKLQIKKTGRFFMYLYHILEYVEDFYVKIYIHDSLLSLLTFFEVILL